MKFRRLNENGMAEFAAYLDRLRDDPKATPPTSYLTVADTSEPLAVDLSAEPETFATRMDFARWLHHAAEASGTEVPRGDVGFWSWLSLALFDQVCPADGNGRRKPFENAWYILALDDRRRAYRHSLFGSYLVFDTLGNDESKTSIFLKSKLTTLGHFWYQLASRQDLMSNDSVLEVANRLYFNEKLQKPKVGALTKKPGSLFRFVRIINQLDRVWDLQAHSSNDILLLLPQEFDAFAVDR